MPDWDDLRDALDALDDAPHVMATAAPVWLTWLADVLRAAGLAVVEQDGWQTRARSSGGFAPGRPVGVMWHHTATNTSPANDANGMSYGSSSAPVANLLVCRDGAVWVLAAGATNTNGAGGPMAGVPVDSMNTYAVGMECANDGVGEPWPQAQIDAMFATSLAICARLGLPPDAAATHYEWAPTRKIDPATAAAVAGPWQPRGVTGSGTWSGDDLRAELRRRSSTGGDTAPPLPTEDDDVRIFARHGNNAWVVFGGGKYWVPTNEAWAYLASTMGEPIPVDATWMQSTGPVVGLAPPECDEWGVVPSG